MVNMLGYGRFVKQGKLLHSSWLQASDNNAQSYYSTIKGGLCA